MKTKTIRLTTAAAIVKFLMAQKIKVGGDGEVGRVGGNGEVGEAGGDGGEVKPLFPGVFAIFGHGNVTCLGPALEEVKDDFPTWRGQNEQGMALAAIGFAKASKRRQIMVATSSIGPGATNMVTSAAVAMANRMPLLIIAGDTFQSRIPDPVLQQVEQFGDPTNTVNDCFRPVVRYWDRLTHPAQVVQSLPNALHTMLDPADCGPAFIGLPQDVAGMAFDFPMQCFSEAVHSIRRPRPDREELARAAQVMRSAERPLVVCGGGVHWSDAEAELGRFVEAHNVPVVETVAGRTCIPQSHPLNAGPIGVIGCESANALAAQADVVLAVGTRLGDFSTGSWTVFGDDTTTQLIAINTARFDATKHRSLPVVADAREALVELSSELGGYRAPLDWSATCASNASQYHAYIDKIAAPDSAVLQMQAGTQFSTQQGAGKQGAVQEQHASGTSGFGEVGGSLAKQLATQKQSASVRAEQQQSEDLPTYAQVVGVIDRVADERTYAVAAAGGFPGEVTSGWRSDFLHSFDTEFGYSCMGYEISGGWGAKMALPERDVVVFVGDGSYLMANSDIYSSVLSGHKLIVFVCDNGGYAVINRLQVNQGGVPFNNLLSDCKIAHEERVDFAAHAMAMGAEAETVDSIAELSAAFERAKSANRTYVIVLQVSAYDWTEGGAWWEVGVPEVSEREQIREARSELEANQSKRRVGW